MKCIVPALLCTAALCSAADVPSEPLAKKGALLFSDDFERAELGEAWRAPAPAWSIADGAMKGSQTRADHGAVGAVHLAFKDAVIEFKFRLEGAASINAVCDDKAWTASHAGHICRTTITPKLIWLGDDKEGGMRNDPARKAERDKLLAGKTATVPLAIESQRWYRLTMEIVGDEMRVSLDGKPVGFLKSLGIGHATKSDFHFTVTGSPRCSMRCASGPLSGRDRSDGVSQFLSVGHSERSAAESKNPGEVSLSSNQHKAPPRIAHDGESGMLADVRPAGPVSPTN